MIRHNFNDINIETLFNIDTAASWAVLIKQSQRHKDTKRLDTIYAHINAHTHHVFKKNTLLNYIKYILTLHSNGWGRMACAPHSQLSDNDGAPLKSAQVEVKWDIVK